MFYLELLVLSVLCLHLCLFDQGVCPHLHLYPCLCLHMVTCLATCLPPFISSFAPPSMYCNALSFLSSSLFCLSTRTGSLGQELAGNLVTGCVEGKANSETHKHRKCCFPHMGSASVSVSLLRLSESGNVSTSLTTCTFFRLSVSISLQLVPAGVCDNKSGHAAALYICLLMHRKHLSKLLTVMMLKSGLLL